MISLNGVSRKRAKGLILKRNNSALENTINMYRNLLLAAILLVNCCVCLSQNSSRQHLNFDEGWKFHLGHAADPSKDFNYSVANIFAKTGVARVVSYGDAFFVDGKLAYYPERQELLIKPLEDGRTFQVL